MLKMYCTVTRDWLYDFVWNFPLSEAANQLGVSSSQLGNACKKMDVPCPAGGYWLKLKAGKPQPKPKLMNAKQGTPSRWNINASYWESIFEVEPPDPSYVHPSTSRKAASKLITHPLLPHVREVLTESKYWADTGHYKPRKYLLPYILVGKTGLDSAFIFANKLYRAFEKAGCPVMIAGHHENFRSSTPDLHLVPKKKKREEYSTLREQWSPMRVTICRVGSVPFIIQIYEMTEEMEVVSQDEKYYRKGTEPNPHRPSWDWGYKNIRDYCCGKLGVRMSSAFDYDGQWEKVWKEDRVRSLHRYIDEIVQEVIAKAPTIASDYLEYRKRKEIEWREYQVKMRQEELAREKRRIEAVREKSRKELIAIIEKWEEADRIARFFSRIENRIMSLPAAERSQALEKIGMAKELLLENDPYACFEQWQLPDIFV